MKLLVLALTSLSLTLTSARAQFGLQESARTGTFEVGGTVQWFSGETVDGHFAGRDGELEISVTILTSISTSTLTWSSAART
jgi:hypothetical protein